MATEQQMQEVLQKAQDMFGDALADPDVYPKQFAYQLKLAQYEMQIAAPPSADNASG